MERDCQLNESNKSTKRNRLTGQMYKEVSEYFHRGDLLSMFKLEMIFTRFEQIQTVLKRLPPVESTASLSSWRCQLKNVAH